MPTWKGVRPFIAATLLAAPGCGSADGGPAVTVRDSAGVKIVESSRPAADDGWEVDAEPSLEIGVADGDPAHQLSGVRGAIRLAGGGVVVASGDAHELRFFDARGTFVGAAGRKGEGPGEFQSIEAAMAYRGDSVAVWDAAAWRLSVFAADGSFGRSATVQGITSITARLKGTFPDGSFLLAPTGSLDDYLRTDEGERRDSVSYVRVAADGSPADTLGRHASMEYVTRSSGNVIMPRPVLLGRDSHAGVGHGRVFLAESDRFRIDVKSPTGTALLSIRRPGELRAPSREELARAREESEHGRRTQERAARLPGTGRPGDGSEDLPVRPTIPAFDRLLVDSQGHLWVRDYLLSSDDEPRWSVYDREGKWVATARTPARLEVYQIGPDWVLGRARDEMDVEYVRVHPLRRVAAGGALDA